MGSGARFRMARRGRASSVAASYPGPRRRSKANPAESAGERKGAGGGPIHVTASSHLRRAPVVGRLPAPYLRDTSITRKDRSPVSSPQEGGSEGSGMGTSWATVRSSDQTTVKGPRRAVPGRLCMRTVAPACTVRAPWFTPRSRLRGERALLQHNRRGGPERPRSSGRRPPVRCKSAAGCGARTPDRPRPFSAVGCGVPVVGRGAAPRPRALSECESACGARGGRGSR